jgi:ketosteroid isomerase-like protein
MTIDPATTRDANKQTLRRAVAGITALDIDAVRAELHDATDFALPWEPAVPDSDRDGFLQLLSMMFLMFKKFDISITDIYDLLDPNTLIACYRGDAEGREKPVAYQNEYVGFFRFVDGKIAVWREYANPEVAHAAVARFADDAPVVDA